MEKASSLFKNKKIVISAIAVSLLAILFVLGMTHRYNYNQKLKIENLVAKYEAISKEEYIYASAEEFQELRETLNKTLETLKGESYLKEHATSQYKTLIASLESKIVTLEEKYEAADMEAKDAIEQFREVFRVDIAEKSKEELLALKTLLEEKIDEFKAKETAISKTSYQEEYNNAILECEGKITEIANIIKEREEELAEIAKQNSQTNATTSNTNPTVIEETESNNPPQTDSGMQMLHEITGFPIVYQRPELPTGCEVTALTMLLRYYGCSVSKTTMASQYLPQKASGYTGKIDLDEYFCGNPYGAGIGCGPGALVTAANSYLASTGSNLRGNNITGTSAEGLYQYIDNGTPIVVMVTIGMANRKSVQGWYTPTGKYVTWSDNDHGLVLIGYSADKVKVACPLFGIKTYSRAQFEKVYNVRGNRAMIVQ